MDLYTSRDEKIIAEKRCKKWAICCWPQKVLNTVLELERPICVFDLNFLFWNNFDLKTFSIVLASDATLQLIHCCSVIQIKTLLFLQSHLTLLHFIDSQVILERFNFFCFCFSSYFNLKYFHFHTFLIKFCLKVKTF